MLAQLAERSKMNFKDLVDKLDELMVGGPNAQQLGTGARGPTVMPKIPTDPNVQQNPLGTGAGPRSVAQKALQAGQSAQTPATPPAEKPIPGQQPNLGPKAATAPVPPQQVIGAPPAPQQQQQNNTGMAAAILQAVNQMKTQQPTMAPTSSQSISAQQQAAVKQATGLQQTAKPGEPLEEQNKVAGLTDKEIGDWVSSLNKDPSYITHPEWKYVDNDSKVKILKTVKANHPSASNYIDIQRKIAKELKSDVPNKDHIAQLEKDKIEAWKAHNTPKKTEPAKTDTTQPTPVVKKPASADEISTQQTLTQTLGKAATNEKDPAKKAQFMKDYEAAAAKLADMQKGSEQPTAPEKNTPAKTDTAKPAGPVVTSAELQKFRDDQGNQNITLGQYLNYKNNLTARKGGANDAEVIQKQLGDKGTAWNPDAPKEPTVNPELDTVQKDVRRDELTRMMKSAGSTPDQIKAVLDREGLTPVEVKAQDDVKSTTVANPPVVPVTVPGAETKVNTTATPADPVAADKNRGYKFIKTDANGKTFLDPFNLAQDNSKNSNLKPGDGPPVRDAVPVTVKEAMQSLVDEMLNEETNTKEDTATTASKWATKSAKLAPWVGNVAKGANAAISASDIADYHKKGDKVGAGIASAALAADAIGTVFPPASWASFALDAANAGRDVYLHQTGQDYKDPDAKQLQAKEELSNIVNLAKYKVDKK